MRMNLCLLGVALSLMLLCTRSPSCIGESHRADFTLSKPKRLSKCVVVCESNRQINSCQAFLGRLSADSAWVVVFENNTGRALTNLSIKLRIGDSLIPEKPETINLVGPNDRVLVELSAEPQVAKVVEKWHGELAGWNDPPTGTILFSFDREK